ncbi:hypothetical protein P167DRAFT_546376 [Morchella conica CCBAS932]|uniref:Uncharacterized protein n=1 Tax=Morchella conica CCBAS932 TaxID=1392247 RepID=A0A3N4KZZ9_9PEZI|nr:hypothetical protein P167DRAFT_546376 [Morchella conica CCBAS932]
MPTLRRYCRVSKYTVLECRIYLDNPSDLTPWLTNVLPRIFASVKPLVLPKLHEEQERVRLGGRKAAVAVKDVIVEDDYELSLFLTNSGTRHAVMTKQKSLPTAPAKLHSNSSKLTGGGGGAGELTLVEIRRESSPPELDLNSIPMAPSAGPIIVPDDDGDRDEEEEGSTRVLGSARRRSTRTKSKRPSALDDDTLPAPPPPKRHKTPTITVPDDNDNLSYLNEEVEGDDKKKLVLQTSYEGFNIYSHILCIVVKRRRGGASTNASAGKGKIMEEWIGMSQAIRDGDE